MRPAGPHAKSAAEKADCNGEGHVVTDDSFGRCSRSDSAGRWDTAVEGGQGKIDAGLPCD